MCHMAQDLEILEMSVWERRRGAQCKFRRRLCVPIDSSSRHMACSASLSLVSEDDGLAACQHQQISDSMVDSAWLLFLVYLPSPDPHASGIRVLHCNCSAAAVKQLCTTDE